MKTGSIDDLTNLNDIFGFSDELMKIIPNIQC